MHFSIAYATVIAFGLSSVVTVHASNDPCADFAAKVSQVYTGYDSTLFRKCIKNVPFNAKNALDTIKNIRKLLSMNTHAIYYIDPPTPELELKAFDVNKTLADIESNISKNAYSNNWSFDRAVVQLFQNFRDEHTVYEPVCTHGFMFVHPYPIAAISSSANDLPDIYHVIHDFDSGAATWTKPVLGERITKINAKDVHDYLGDFIQNSAEELNWIDPDARFNNVFAVYPGTTARGRFAHRNMWDGEALKLTWRNGSETTVKFTVSFSTAMVDSDGLMFKDTETLTELCFAAAGSKRNGTIEKREVSRRSDVAPNGYPINPEGYSEEYAMITYPLPSDNETVVLALRTFTPQLLETRAFVNAQSQFLKTQIASWKLKKYKRLIIDVTNNPGGKSIIPYDALKQLFPAEDDHTTVNMHYSPTTWAYLLGLPGEDENTNWHKPDGSEISMEELLSPVEKDGSYFTNMLRADYQEIGDELYGLDVDSHTGDPPFSPSNIVIVSNSLCASACHSFVEMMRARSVRAISYGGRANKTSPMQAVGGTKGGSVAEYDSVQSRLDNVAQNTTVADIAGEPDKWLLDPMPVNVNSLKVNSQNMFRVNESLPLMFVYTPACRRFFITKDMMDDVQNMWKHTREIAWDQDGKESDCTNYRPVEAAKSTASGNAPVASDVASDGENESQKDKDISSSGFVLKPAYFGWRVGISIIVYVYVLEFVPYM